MQPAKCRAALFIGAIVLSACPQLGAMDMRKAAEIGMIANRRLGASWEIQRRIR